MELAILNSLFAESLAWVDVPVTWGFFPADAGLEHAVACFLVEEKHAEEVVAECLVMEAIDHRVIDLVLVPR